MKKNYLFLLSIIFITGCGKSTTSESGSVSSQIDSESISNSENLDSQSASEQEKSDYKALDTNVDFNVLNSTEGLTPSQGNVNILVIPIHFKDSKKQIDKQYLNTAFNSSNSDDVEYFSVKDYYDISSYGKLNLSFDVLDTYTAENTISYYNENYSNASYVDASHSIMEEALKYYDSTIDYSKYDSNNDGYVDGVIMVYDAPVDMSRDNYLWWAYTTYYSGNLQLDNLKFKSNIFAGLDFFKLNKCNCDTHTIIHETAHMFGVDDYYDYVPTSGANEGGLAGGDIMDATVGDHNSFTKSLLNWNTPTLITSKSTITVDLKPFEENGDYLILANDFDESKGLFQEYFILEYYTNTKLNSYDKVFGKDGIRMLHIKADTKKNGTFKYNNSTGVYKLISQITTKYGTTYASAAATRSDESLFVEGNELIECYYFGGTELLNYTFKVDALTYEKATLTITYKEGK